ncbi:hypothetical protein [Sigmofec virus UA08Rod_5530]|uniref:Uncharacterized protein n=1 Tax=Sigmofec virus UA08Rod_5530 TaxID=2929427 RepID=A0A976N0T5_9VIRU|nr:hypothetical protein [Sigmofec virus UA08Rod_5530]
MKRKPVRVGYRRFGIQHPHRLNVQVGYRGGRCL